MKYLIQILFLFSMLCGITQASPISSKVLSLPITTLSGETISLGQFKGNQPVYLKFWATWCRPCRKQMPHFQDIQKKYGQKIKVIAVNLGVNDSVKQVHDTKDEFGLTMPIAIDTSGKLAQAFNLVGTPYHVLIDKKGNIVHTGFEASKALDKKIQLVITNKPITLPDISLSPSSDSKSQRVIKHIDKKPTVLFFVATWCDWYLKESRTAMSKQCVTAQNSINALYPQFPQFNWVGIASRLWTGEKELEEYKKKYNIIHPIEIDTTNNAFFNYRVKKFPTLILVNNGKEVLRINEFNNQKQLSEKLKQFSSR
ncbi:MAG: redoxin domain-containing protein [Thiohalomonadales bacterium]